MINNDRLRLEGSLCFPLYACSREEIKKHRGFLDAIGLTYTQYIVMLLLWEYGSLSAKELGEKLYLDSGTLTPVLKGLQEKNYLTRCRSEKDERVLTVSVTQEGARLKEKAALLPDDAFHTRLSPEEETQLLELLYKLLGNS